jgi:ABC-type nitrate/sulfonate/bicarbonate transport system permease component
LEPTNGPLLFKKEMKITEYFLPNFIGKISSRSKFLIIFVQVALILILTQFNSNELVPKPLGIIHSFFSVIGKVDFVNDLMATLTLVFKGMSLSILISLLICYLSLVPIFNGIAQLVSKMRYLTYTGLLFVFTILLKDGGSIKTSLLLLGIIPYFVTSLVSYIGEISQKEYQLCYTLKMNRWQILYEVVIRGRLHTVLEVIRQNFAIAWMMITSVEGISMSQGGLGTLMIKYNKYLKIDDVFAILLIIFVTGIIFDYLFSLAKVYIFPYTDTKRYGELWINKLSTKKHAVQ